MMSKIKSRKIANVKILIGIVLAASLIAVFACEQKPEVKSEKSASKKTETITFDGRPLQIVGDSTDVENLKNLISASSNYKMVRDISTGEMKLVSKNSTTEEIKLASVDRKLSSSDEVFMVVEEMPEYPGGVPALRQFLANSVKYPEEAIKKGIQGKVYVNFVVEKDGSIVVAKIARGVSPELDAEALRVVKLMSKWKPGKQKGEAVRVSYTVPINFALQ